MKRTGRSDRVLPILEKRFLPPFHISKHRTISRPSPSLRLREAVERFAKISLRRHSISTASSYIGLPDDGPSHAIVYVVMNN